MKKRPKLSEVNDVSTKNERKLLRKLEKVRPDMKDLFIWGRFGPKDGQFDGVTTILRRKHVGSWYAVYCINLGWVRREIKRVGQQLRRELRKEIQDHLGAYI